MKKNNKPAAKRYMKTVGMVMASVMVLSSTTGQMVYAESAKDQKDTQDGEKKEEKTIVYLNGKTGNDKNSGESQDEAVKSFEKAAELAGSCGVIRICGTDIFFASALFYVSILRKYFVLPCQKMFLKHHIKHFSLISYYTSIIP